MREKKLYQIWRINKNPNKPPPWSTYIEFDEVAGTWAYPLVEIISVLPERWCRDDMVSMDLPRLEEFCQYLNEIADSDVRFEIREIKREE